MERVAAERAEAAYTAWQEELVRARVRRVRGRVRVRVRVS